MNDIFIASFDRLLAGECTPGIVRQIESGEDPSRLWNCLRTAGFCDLLVAEDDGGAGLSLLDAAPLLAACGRFAMPLPLAFTMLARAQVAPRDLDTVTGPITISSNAVRHVDGALRCDNVPFGRVSDWVMVEYNARCELWSTQNARIEPDGIDGSVEASLIWSDTPHTIPLSYIDTRIAGAAVTALLISGAMEKILDITIAYANDRSQFGRPIGKFQAIQQQISVLAELTFSARMASRLACSPLNWTPSSGGTAVAKAYTSHVASTAAMIAHAVHGAIGITHEYELNLYTRRLHSWRRAYGAETAWFEHIGSTWLNGGDSALDFVRATLSSTES